jgi:DNA repair exonuclease SbcCD ATPase subunit
MWYEEHNQFVRGPVPKSLDLLVEELQNRDSVLFESVSLPSLSVRSNRSTDNHTARSKTALTSHREHVIDFSDDFVAEEDPPETTTELQLRALLDRVHELEAANHQKNHEIAELKKKLAQRTGADPQLSADAQFYKTQYERMKQQFDKLKQALAAEGKLRRVRLRSACAVKLSV